MEPSFSSCKGYRGTIIKIFISIFLWRHSIKAVTDILNACIAENQRVNVANSLNIWCRDYMPVQTPSGKYIQFTYTGYGGDNKYKKYPWLKVNPNIWSGFEPLTKSNIHLDGGNCVIDYGRAFITSIVFKHNPQRNKLNLIKELELLLEVPVIIIPVEPGDDLGHTDGILRGVSKDTVLINDYSVMQQKQYDKYQKSLLRVLEKEGLKYEFMPYAYQKTLWTSKKKWREKYPFADDFNPGYGYYINFLPLGDAVLVPSFEIYEDAAAASVLRRWFKRVYSVDCSDLSMEGGLVNCCTREYLM